MESWVAGIIADALGFQCELIVKVKTRLRRLFHSGIQNVWVYIGPSVKRLVESARQGKIEVLVCDWLLSVTVVAARIKPELSRVKIASVGRKLEAEASGSSRQAS